MKKILKQYANNLVAVMLKDDVQTWNLKEGDIVEVEFPYHQVDFKAIRQRVKQQDAKEKKK